MGAKEFQGMESSVIFTIMPFESLVIRRVDEAYVGSGRTTILGPYHSE